MMINNPPRTSRQPKLRSSCDGCGSAKLKCDRGQPECGRCISLGITCVYGVSRKMGKPPRERLHIPAMLGGPRTAAEHNSNGKEGGSDDSSYNRRAGSSISDTILPRTSSSSSINDIRSTWGAVEEYSNNSMTTRVNMLDEFRNDQLGPSLTNFSSLDTNEWVLTNIIGDELSSTNLETEPFPALGWPDLESSPASTGQTTGAQTPADDRIYLDSPFMQHDDIKHHDCSQEAYGIMNSLSSLNISKAYSRITPPPGTTTNSINCVPLDFILQLNREAIERLGRLLSCSCANYSHLAFLYASIIGRILHLYSQEAGCLKTSSLGLTPNPTIRHGMSPSCSSAGSMCRSPSSWLSAGAGTANTSVSGSSTPSGKRNTTTDLAPTQMTMGCFSIDDKLVQAALRIQLLLGEMKRVGFLIDVFTSRSSNGADESTSGNIDDLYKSLGSWLGKEHLRIVEMMRVRLRDISI
ncbi:hypothetical protein F5Y00DRAFT_268378 [Daldinia vernicosa]|uniref:uncharacterized protein n=1 Tax=Daldinia vernicosa TaxID=114800 RepID=UPI0020079990|nr:uncharacterized protein F5Y00DRAFT_268378 [Daldinia vernicosa]KAI0850639.1 hypothetical protein F5Y00DRAFT_268378 [Daldinia vernicosa]